MYTVSGEYNLNARVQVAQFGGENAAFIHNLAKRNDSGQNCPRAEEFQLCCLDGFCPDCNGSYINVDQLHDETICAVVAQNVINQIPSLTEEDNLTKLFGHAVYEQVDSKRFNSSRGTFAQNQLSIARFRLSVSIEQIDKDKLITLLVS